MDGAAVTRGHERTGSFSLEEDLERLRGVASMGALEAVAFYASRILEGIVREALEELSIAPSAFLLNNLLRLEELNLLPRAMRYWAHALRRLGNEARHLGRRIGSPDADLALALTERLLAWRDRRSRGSRPSSEEVDLGSPRAVRDFLEALEDRDLDPVALSRSLPEEQGRLLLSAPVLPAVLAEMLIERGSHEEAERIIDQSSMRFGRDTRLRQLKGLCLSRTGRLREALDLMEDLACRDDPETAGIAGGILKRLWRLDGDRRHLAEAGRRYLEAWLRSRRTNVYVGVNAAATLLWLGREAESRHIARECRSRIEERIEIIHRVQGSGSEALNGWDALAYAESLVLAGKLEEGRRMYRKSLETRGGSSDPGLALEQLDVDLKALGVDRPARDFLSLQDPSSDLREVLIGITGHRDIRPSPTLLGKIRGAIEEIRSSGGGEAVCLVALSPLAEGADRIVARSIIDLPPSRLRAVFPFPLEEYGKDFGDGPSRSEFQDLLSRAASIEHLGEVEEGAARWDPRSPVERTELYAACGRHIVDRCDVLIAVWDGAPSRGPGGTAEIVAYATGKGRTCKVIWP